MYPVLLLVACVVAPPDEPSTPTVCAPGTVADGSTCVPEVCGTGTWGDISVDDGTLFVDVDAPEGGDGSEAEPFRSIQEGVDEAGGAGGGLVAVAAGIYLERVVFDPIHDGVHLAGRCRELVIIDARGHTLGIDSDTLDGEVEIEGVTISGATTAGLAASSGSTRLADSRVTASEWFGIRVSPEGMAIQASLEVDRCEVDTNATVAVLASGMGATVHLTDTVIRDSLWAHGIQADSWALLSADGCEVAENAQNGVFAIDRGTRVTLRDTVIRDTRPWGGTGGYGVQALGGASIVMEGGEVDGNTGAGVVSRDEGTRIALHDVVVRGTTPHAKDFGPGIGIGAYAGGSLDAEDCEVDRTEGVGVAALDVGTSVMLRDVGIRNGDIGGIFAQSGASLVADDCEVDSNGSIGVLATDPGTRITLHDMAVRDTGPDGNGDRGYGIMSQEGASLLAEGGVVSGNHGAGVVALGTGSSLLLHDMMVRDTRTDWSGDVGTGIGAAEGASLVVENCEVTHNSTAGIGVWDPGTRAIVRESTISGTMMGTSQSSSAAPGIAVKDGASASADHVMLLMNEGPGILVDGDDSTMECFQCSIKGSQFAGGAAIRGGALAISDSTIEGTVAGMNLLGGAGVYAWSWDGSPPTVILTQTLIRDNPIAGAWLIGNGTYVLTDSTIMGGVGTPFGTGSRCGDAVLAIGGVKAWDGSSGLLIQENALQDATGAGVFLDGSSAMLSNNTYSGNTLDLVIQDQDCATIDDYYYEAPLHEFCPDYSYPSCYAEFFYVALPGELLDTDVAVDDPKAPAPLFVRVAFDDLPTFAADDYGF